MQVRIAVNFHVEGNTLTLSPIRVQNIDIVDGYNFQIMFSSCTKRLKNWYIANVLAKWKIYVI